mgnify:CR=1 FL=1
MTDNAADGQAITEIQMGAAAAPEPTVVVAATLADAAELRRTQGLQRHRADPDRCGDGPGSRPPGADRRFRGDGAV